MSDRKAKMREKMTKTGNNSNNGSRNSIKSEEGENKVKLGGNKEEQEPGFLEKLKSNPCCQ